MSLMIGPEPETPYLDVSEMAFQQWRHHPLTAAFMRFMKDQADNWREGAMDLWEMGQLVSNHQHPDLNSDVIRGKVIALRELREIRLEQIQEFYRQQAQQTEE